MSHHSLASNNLWITDEVSNDGTDAAVNVNIYPSSPETGAASINTTSLDFIGPVALLTLDDVLALRDHLNVCIAQAANVDSTEPLAEHVHSIRVGISDAVVNEGGEWEDHDAALRELEDRVRTLKL